MKKRMSVIVVGLLLVLLSVVPAMAQGVTDEGAITLNPGSLTATPKPITFVAFALDGADHDDREGTTTAWNVTDARGSGAGYIVNITATNFVNEDDETIPVAGFEMTLPADAITLLAGNAKPVSSFTSAKALGASQTMVTAAAGEGMGSYSLLPTFTLDIPAETYAGAYTSVVTLETAAVP